MTINECSSEARKRLGRLPNIASEENEDVVIEVRGEPTAVIVSYSQYEQMVREREDETRMKALRQLRKVRSRVQENMGGVSREEAYRMAGFGENAIKEVIRHEDEGVMNEGS